MVPIVRAYQFIILQFGEGISESTNLICFWMHRICGMRPAMRWSGGREWGTWIFDKLRVPRFSLLPVISSVNITLITFH